MQGAKTNEQYKAFSHEIEYVEKEIRKAEDRILELMGESESLDANVKKAEVALKEEKVVVEEEKARARKRTAEDQGFLDTHRAQRAEVTGQAAESDSDALRPDPREAGRGEHRRGGQFALPGLPDHDSSAVYAGSEKRHGTDALRAVRPVPVH